MNPYRVLITHEALSLPKPSASDRARLLRFLDQLSSNPDAAGDYHERDDADRIVQIKIIGRYALTYWADHAVREVKVTRIERAD